MSKKVTDKRLASAQERLRRIEKKIGPYLDTEPQAGRPVARRYVPADSIHILEREPRKPGEEPQRLAAYSN